MEREREVLVIRGYLDRAGRFRLRRSRSTDFVRQWPVVEKSDVHVELLDGEHRVLHREPVEVKADVTCDPGAPRRFRVLAYVELRDDAQSVRLRRQDLDLWERKIPKAPSVAVALAARRIGRERPLRLDVRCSPGGEDAHLTVVYKWGERRFRPIYIGPPAESLELDLAGLPGGEACQLVVSYSNGLRSAQAATARFAVPPLAPTLAILRPARREILVAGTPVVFEGTLVDEQRPGPRRDDALVWLVDGAEIGRGLIASVDGLSPGRHRLALEYRAEPVVRTEMTIACTAPETPTANEWAEWDPVSGNS